MNRPEIPADGDGTLHDAPDDLLDAPRADRPPTSDSPFVPPYAEHVESAAAPQVDASAFAFADVAAEPVAPPAAPAAPTAAAPGSRASSTLAARARRWVAPVALVAAGLLGGMAVTGAVTNAGASTPASPSTVSDGGSVGTRGGGPSADSGPGLTLDQLEGTPDDDSDDRADAGARGGHRGDGPHGDGRSLADGFTLAPTAQGTTGASS